MAVSACLLLVSFSPAQAADFGLKPGSFRTDLATKQAGAHADLVTSFEVNADAKSHPEGGSLKDLSIDLPKGIVAAAGATSTCPMNMVLEFPSPCPQDSAVGKVTAVATFPENNERSEFTTMVYNVTPTADEPAALSFRVFLAAVRLDVSVRTNGDYGISATASSLSEDTYIVAAHMTLWGVPADHNGPGPELDTSSGRSFGGPGSGPRKAFMTNPTKCSAGPLVSSMAIDSWQHPGTFVGAGFETDPIVGCDRLTFGPNLDLRPDTRVAGAPAGYAIDFAVPQNADASGLATPHVKDVKIELPAGVGLSATVADGLGSCSDEEVQMNSAAEPRCPQTSKIATLAIETPLTEDPLQGSVYLGTQLSNDPLSGQMVRLFLVVKGAGVTIKLPGSVAMDPDTGRLTVSFPKLPQLPFGDVHLEFASGSRAALTTPEKCGTYTTHSEITSWASDIPTLSNSSFIIDRNCDRASRFTPSLEAGVLNPVAGLSSPFTAKLIREDGQPNLATMRATLPEGEAAKLSGVPLCTDAEAATGSCGAASQIGTAIIAAGSGPSPLYVPQPGKARPAVYLAAPYKGAPYSIVVKIPAQAGPFDLGTVVARMAMRIDPETAQVTVESDPLPQVVRGVPFSYRTIYLSFDRPDFTQNPTSCDPMRVTSAVTSIAGQAASPSTPFQVADCERLGFKPKLSLSLSGPTHRSGFPRLQATLKARKGDANIGRAVLTLPPTEFLENAHIRAVCTRPRYAAGTCPPKSIYGYVRAWSPLLGKPLAGPVYLRSSDHPLPDLAASLDGELHVDLVGRVDSVDSRIRNTFEALPDVPVSKLTLTMRGGSRGLLVNNTDLCRATPRAEVVLAAQNGKTRDLSVAMGTDCGAKRKK